MAEPGGGCFYAVYLAMYFAMCLAGCLAMCLVMCLKILFFGSHVLGTRVGRLPSTLGAQDLHSESAYD